MLGTYSIKIDTTVSLVVHGPRKDPAALFPRITEKLKENEKEGHLAKVANRLRQFFGIHTERREDSNLHRPIGSKQSYKEKTLSDLNSGRNHHKDSQSQMFSVLDAKSGYLQMNIDYESSLLTTMNTPLGRYQMYQRAMDDMLEGTQYAHAVMDDILVAGRDKVHHDAVLQQVLDRARSYNLKLNFDKVKIRKDKVRYVGHLKSVHGVKPDPEKVEAMRNVPAPENKDDVRCFLGLVQYLANVLTTLS